MTHVHKIRNSTFSFAVIVLIVLAGNSWGQNPPAISVATNSSEGAMQGVNLQQTNFYPGKAVQRINTMVWKSLKYFTINYARALTLSFDGSVESNNSFRWTNGVS